MHCHVLYSTNVVAGMLFMTTGSPHLTTLRKESIQAVVSVNSHKNHAFSVQIHLNMSGLRYELHACDIIV